MEAIGGRLTTPPTARECNRHSVAVQHPRHPQGDGIHADGNPAAVTTRRRGHLDDGAGGGNGQGLLLLVPTTTAGQEPMVDGVSTIGRHQRVAAFCQGAMGKGDGGERR